MKKVNNEWTKEMILDWLIDVAVLLTGNNKVDIKEGKDQLNFLIYELKKEIKK